MMGLSQSVCFLVRGASYTKANTGATAHPRLVICVSLRTAASAEAPLAPMLLLKRLCG